jgi:hypothetical protein
MSGSLARIRATPSRTRRTSATTTIRNGTSPRATSTAASIAPPVGEEAKLQLHQNASRRLPPSDPFRLGGRAGTSRHQTGQATSHLSAHANLPCSGQRLGAFPGGAGEHALCRPVPVWRVGVSDAAMAARRGVPRRSFGPRAESRPKPDSPRLRSGHGGLHRAAKRVRQNVPNPASSMPYHERGMASVSVSMHHEDQPSTTRWHRA